MEAPRHQRHHHPYSSSSSHREPGAAEEFFLGPSDMLLHQIMKTAEMNSFYDGNSQNRSPGLSKSKKKSAYKHVPHADKPPAMVAKRNARERRRVQAVNGAFTKLRRHIPYENKNKRLSKVKTLKIAIDYIHHLEDMIDDYDAKVSSPISQRAPLTSSPAGADDNCQSQTTLGYLSQGQTSEVFGSPMWTLDQVSPTSATSGSSMGQTSESCYRPPQQQQSYLWGQSDVNQDHMCYSGNGSGNDYNRTVMSQTMSVMHSHTL